MKDAKRFVLALLLAHGETPTAESVIVADLRIHFADVTTADAQGVIAALEADGYVSGTNDDLLGRQWMLTTKGSIRAAQLRG